MCGALQSWFLVLSYTAAARLTNEVVVCDEDKMPAYIQATAKLCIHQARFVSWSKELKC